MGLALIGGIVSATIDYSDTAAEEQFKLLVTIAAVKAHCGEVTITVADKSEHRNYVKEMKNHLKSKE